VTLEYFELGSNNAGPMRNFDPVTDQFGSGNCPF
jgi:hypothetical protein